jgi:cell division protein FtsB
MERDDAVTRKSPHTDQFLLWSAFLLLLTAAFLMYVSLREERERLAGLEKVQADRQADFERIEAARKQGQQILGRFHDDDEFVRDQARERLGIAAPDEVVIRIESGAAGAPTKTGGPLFAPGRDDSSGAR